MTPPLNHLFGVHDKFPSFLKSELRVLISIPVELWVTARHGPKWKTMGQAVRKLSFEQHNEHKQTHKQMVLFLVSLKEQTAPAGMSSSGDLLAAPLDLFVDNAFRQYTNDAIDSPTPGMHTAL